MKPQDNKFQQCDLDASIPKLSRWAPWAVGGVMVVAAVALIWGIAA